MSKTLKLIYPLWQGGGVPLYVFGTQLLNWLSPKHNGPVEQVHVNEPTEEIIANTKKEDGITGKSQVLEEHQRAKELIEKHQPDKLIVLGGDCAVDLVPFNYLKSKYDDLVILWVDTHPDIISVQYYDRSHAMVLGNLMGHGDKDFLSFVTHPFRHDEVVYAGLQKTMDHETKFLEKNNLKRFGSKELEEKSDVLMEWLGNTGAKHVAVHLDLDCLDPEYFRHLLFAKPIQKKGAIDFERGKFKMSHVARLLADVSNAYDIVGLGITEHLPYDSFNLKNFLATLPLIGDTEKAKDFEQL